MVLQVTAPGNYPGRIEAPKVFRTKRRHGTTMAFTTGDLFVLTTAEWDENHEYRDFTYPVAVFCMERISHREPFSYSIRYEDNRIVTAGNDLIALNKYLSIRPVQPLTQVSKYKGISTLFLLEVAHGYRVHYLDYVQKKLPEIYNQLNFS